MTRLLLAASGVLFVVVFGALIFIGAFAPPTQVLPGAQLPAQYAQMLREKAGLSPGEPILFFYSDALWNVGDRFYALTESRLVIHGDDWEEPTVSLAFDEIEDVEGYLEPAWHTDSRIWVVTKEGAEYLVSLSSEGGGDKRFLTALTKRVRAQER